MPRIFNTVLDPSGAVHKKAKVVVELVSTTEEFSKFGRASYDPASNKTILGAWETVTDDNGYWEVTLEPNANVFPAGSYYKVTEHPRGAKSDDHAITVPVGAGPFHIFDILRP